MRDMRILRMCVHNYGYTNLIRLISCIGYGVIFKKSPDPRRKEENHLVKEFGEKVSRKGKNYQTGEIARWREKKGIQEESRRSPPRL